MLRLYYACAVIIAMAIRGKKSASLPVTVSPHSFLVLKNQPGGFPRGALVEWKEDGYDYHSHSGAVDLSLAGIHATIANSDFSVLTEKECFILDAISSEANRYTVYSTPGKLKWAVGLKVGSTVLARLPVRSGHGSSGGENDEYANSTIRWIGRIQVLFGDQHYYGVEIKDRHYYGCGNTDGTFDLYGSTKTCFACKQNRGLFLTLDEMKDPHSPNEGSSIIYSDLQDCVSQLEKELRQKTQENQQLHQQISISEERCMMEVRRKEDTITRLQREVSGKEDAIAILREKERAERNTIASMQRDMREKEDVIARLQGEVRRNKVTIIRLEEDERGKEDAIIELQEETREKDDDLSSVYDQLTGQRDHHVIELRQLGLQVEQYQQQLREEQAQHQLLVTRIDTAMSHLRGEPVSPQALELWKLPRDEVHISQTLLGTGGWGYVARGTFRGQTVAVKCLHQTFLSAENKGKLRHEINIMSQVRHPNLVLLIGAVLTTEGDGTLIVTEFLDRSLRSTYEEGSLEERSKVPVLRDVASALTYLHSHHTPILHRDVNSANVLLEYASPDVQWKAKLSDYGSSILSYLASTFGDDAVVYTAPEVSTEDWGRQTAKIDVYSFGVLVCEVCLCQFPPERSHFPSMLSEVHHTAPNLFLLARDCTSHSHQDRPTMKEVLQMIDIL